MPIGLGDDADAEAAALEETADQRTAERRVIDVGVAADDQDVELVPAAGVHLRARGRQVRRSCRAGSNPDCLFAIGGRGPCRTLPIRDGSRKRTTMKGKAEPRPNAGDRVTFEVESLLPSGEGACGRNRIAGAFPGERVVARIDHVGKHATFATTVDVERGRTGRRGPPCLRHVDTARTGAAPAVP